MIGLSEIILLLPDTQEVSKLKREITDYLSCEKRKHAAYFEFYIEEGDDKFAIESALINIGASFEFLEYDEQIIDRGDSADLHIPAMHIFKIYNKVAYD